MLQKRIKAYFQGMFYFLFFNVQQSTFIQIQSCHFLLVAAKWWRAGFHLTVAYFWGRAYITSIWKNHTRAYFQVRSYFGETGYEDIGIAIKCITLGLMQQIQKMMTKKLRYRRELLFCILVLQMGIKFLQWVCLDVTLNPNLYKVRWSSKASENWFCLIYKTEDNSIICIL